MKRKSHLPALFLAAALMCLPAAAWSQQTQTPPPADNGAQAKQDMRNAGHETKDAAHDAGQGVKHGTQHAYHSTKRHSKRAWRRTKNAARDAKEGAEQPQ